MKQTRTKRIVLGITGGIAAYKAAELLRLLIKQEFDVQVAMTAAATHFITPTTLQALSGQPVFTSQWDERASNAMAHITLSRAADAIVIAPASANFIAKLAHGLADDLLSTLCLARNCPLIIAPAMNREMWLNAATQRNIAQLIADGVQVLGPDSGLQACGEEGMGRMLEAELLAQNIIALLPTRNAVEHINVDADLAQSSDSTLTFKRSNFLGRKILITAGPTYEAIDAVRGITNRSSGKMGYAIAQAARALGAQVTLVSGPTTLARPAATNFVAVESAAEMFAAVKNHVAQCDIFIAVAAVADYRIAHPSEQKIKKSGAPLTLELIANPDILAFVANLPNAPFCVGFAAESENLLEYAEAKRRAKKLPLLVGNLAQHAIGSNDNELVLFDDDGAHPLPRGDKISLAKLLMQHIAQRFEGTQK